MTNPVRFQLVTNKARASEIIMAENMDGMIAGMERLGYKATGKEGGQHLREILRGKPMFEGLYGPMYGEDNAGNPLVRYEDPASYDFLSR